MSRQDDFWLDHPPVWEVGLSVQTGERGVMDNYDVRSAHDLFRSEYPRVERHEPAILFADPALQEVGPNDALYRWWLMSDAGENLIQLQENLVCRNWRRRELPPAMPHPYPGFERSLAGFKQQVEALRAARPKGAAFPDPMGCELLYDNFLMLRVDGEELHLRDVFAPLIFEPPIPLKGLTMVWVEDVPHGGEDGALRIQMAVHGVSSPEDSSVVPVVRLNFSAKKPVVTWEEAYEFMSLAQLSQRTSPVKGAASRC